MKAFLFAAAATAVALAAPASARVVSFTITNLSAPDRGDFYFELDDARTPDVVTATSVRFAAVNGGAAVPVRYGHVADLPAGTAANGGVTFFTTTNQGGLALSGIPGIAGTFQLKNTTLIENASFNTMLPRAQNKPVYKLGTFLLSTTAQNSGPRPVDNYSVTIAVVPEPATWAMMIAGFGAVGLGLRRRARPVTV
jgi:hypothetical protein